MVRSYGGRRSRTQTERKRGRYIQARPANGNSFDLAFDATVRAAAPFQEERKKINDNVAFHIRPKGHFQNPDSKDDFEMALPVTFPAQPVMHIFLKFCICYLFYPVLGFQAYPINFLEDSLLDGIISVQVRRITDGGPVYQNRYPDKLFTGRCIDNPAPETSALCICEIPGKDQRDDNHNVLFHAIQ